MTLALLMKALHLLSVLGVFGGLLVYQLGLPGAVRNDPVLARRANRLLSLLLLTGLLAGVFLFLKALPTYRGTPAAGHFHGLIGFKLLVLVAVGGLLPLSRRPGRGDVARWIAIALLVTAALAGLMI
jgi:hypothetical protein